MGAEWAASRMPESLAYARLPACDCSESISGRQLPPLVAMPAPWRTQPARHKAPRTHMEPAGLHCVARPCFAETVLE